MNKIKTIIAAVALTGIIPSAHAQLFNIKLGNDLLVESAIRNAVAVVETGYCLQDTTTDKKYGRNGKAEFNILSFLGCKTDNGVVVPAYAATPWVVDSDFDRYRSEQKYRPLIEGDMIVSIPALQTSDTLAVSPDFKSTANGSFISLGLPEEKEAAEELMLTDGTPGELNWIVWVKKNADSSDLTYNIVKRTLDFASEDLTLQYPDISSPLGALYVTAKVMSVGLVEFSIAGMAVKQGGNWVMQPLTSESFTVKAEEATPEVTPATENDPDELTAVPEESSKRKKKKD